jgi:hypothetical protein
LRKTFPELNSSIINPLLAELPQGAYTYNSWLHTMKIGKSVLEFGHCQYQKDVFKYQGGEWDFIAIDELTLFTEFEYRFILSRLRSTKKNMQPNFFASANPGGIGHLFVKRLWISRDFLGKEKPEDYDFIPARVYDNKYLIENDPEYINRLENLPEKQRMAMLDGNWDVFEGQYFCLDKKTEILTRNGFRTYDKISQNDEIATNINGKLNYEKIKKIWKFPYKGEMIKYTTSNGLNFCVTPNHRMLAKARDRKNIINKKFNFIRADQLKGEMVLPRTISWKGKSPKHIVIPKIYCAKKPKMKFLTGDFLEFLGWYLSEGSLVKNSTHAKTSNKYRGLSIAQTKQKECKKIEQLLTKMGLHHQYHGHGIEVSSTSLAKFLLPLGDSFSKYIPREYLEFNTKELERLFLSLMLGDGCKIGNDSWSYFTVSEQLANDVQELATKLNRIAVISKREKDYSIFSYKGKKTKIHASLGYVITISRSSRKNGFITKKFLKRIFYDDIVWCVTTQSGVIFTRREGRCVWTGNSQWNSDIHVTIPFEIPVEWKKIICVDYGFTKPSAVYWLAEDGDGIIFVYKELYGTGMVYSQLAEKIKGMTAESELIHHIVIDPSCMTKDPSSGISLADELREQRIATVIPGNNARLPGWTLIRKLLKPYDHPEANNALKKKAKLIFFSNCVNAIRTLPVQIHDTVRVEDLNSKNEDHACDAIRYGCMSLSSIASMPIKGNVSTGNAGIFSSSKESFSLDDMKWLDK